MTDNPPSVKIAQVPTIGKAVLLDYVCVAHHLPQDQRRQWEALSDGQPYDPERMALSLASRGGPKWSLIDVDGTPLAVGGYDMLREGVWQDWLIGTEQAWAQHWRAITKHCKRVMNLMLEHEAHRLQTIALADRVMAHKWFGALGLEYEGLLRGYGHSGEDCVIYSRVSNEVRDGRR